MEWRALRAYSCGFAVALAVLPACSGDGETPAGNGTSGSAGRGGSGGAGTGAIGGSSAGGSGGAGGNAGGASGAGGQGTGGAAGAGAQDGGGGQGPVAGLVTVAANTTVGLEWDAVAGAQGYRVYFSTSAGVTPQTGQALEVAAPNLVHRGLTNGTPYHYVVTAISGGGESAPSTEVSATPAGEWVLEEFGTGIFDDVQTGAPVPRIALDKRLHVLLFGEGYTAPDQAALHALATHDGNRANDVDRWVDLVFGIEPYRAYRQAFLVWYLPRVSNAHLGGDTAFQVPVTSEGTSFGVGQVQADGETAARAWAALGLFPFPPTDFSGGGFGSVRNLTAAFLMFDPNRGRAGVSGRATSLRNPAATSQRLSSAFGVGHAHEFTHAFASLRDEYLEDDNDAPTNWSGTSNVAGASVCAELPWAHLLRGTAINPNQGDLVGAFGRPQHGYHSELLCLLNGTHDNAAYYGGDGLLRVEDRMCNFCRETTAFRIHQRSGVLESGDAGFGAWTSGYRSPFFARFGFSVPSVVPQTNDVRNPAQGTPVYEACTGASTEHVSRQPSLGLASYDRRPGGCVLAP
jgi:hypothetical protein